MSTPVRKLLILAFVSHNTLVVMQWWQSASSCFFLQPRKSHQPQQLSPWLHAFLSKPPWSLVS